MTCEWNKLAILLTMVRDVASTPGLVGKIPWVGREDPLEKDMATHSDILA